LRGKVSKTRSEANKAKTPASLLGISSHSDKIAFFPYFFIKDTLGLVGFLIFFSF
jgi:quinol-cytochrome oxidoreductase complex cytochrome b subunit